MKRDASGGVTHAPFTLGPWPVPAAAHERMAGLTAAFNRLALAVAAAPGFLRDVLAPLEGSDPFVARLLALSEPREQPLALAITRNDFFLATPAGSEAAGGETRPLQVELNTIAASYPGLAGAAARLHAYLCAGTPLAPRLAPNDPIPGIAGAIHRAWERYGDPRAQVLMAVQPGERNVFDQRMLEFALRARGLDVVRRSLEAIGESGSLREGHLWIEGRPVAVAYLRAGYGPEDYVHLDAWRGRERIERSDAIAVPTAAQQLAGSKKVQQVLTRPDELARFCTPDEAEAIRAVFAGIWDPEEPIATPEGDVPAWEAALREPGAYVLKPQREGGGNNFFDDDLAARLRGSDAAARSAYILMERIRPPRRPALLVLDGRLSERPAVSEIGRFGVTLASGADVLHEADVGYLVRTKDAESREGGVSAGFGYLSSLAILEDGT